MASASEGGYARKPPVAFDSSWAARTNLERAAPVRLGASDDDDDDIEEQVNLVPLPTCHSRPPPLAIASDLELATSLSGTSESAEPLVRYDSALGLQQAMEVSTLDFSW